MGPDSYGPVFVSSRRAVAMAAAEQVPVTRRPTLPNLSIGCALVMQILVLRVTIDLTMFAKP